MRTLLKALITKYKVQSRFLDLNLVTSRGFLHATELNSGNYDVTLLSRGISLNLVDTGANESTIVFAMLAGKYDTLLPPNKDLWDMLLSVSLYDDVMIKGDDYQAVLEAECLWIIVLDNLQI